MNYNKKTIMDVDVAGKKILLRCDFNVPQDKETHAITSDKRIVASLPTIRYLLERGAAVIACSHLGKPKGQWKDSLTLRPVAERLSQLLGQEVIFAKDIVGEDAKAKAAALQGGQIMLLENLRFDPREEKNDPEFARELASMAELYVSDAFGTVHRAHASTAGVAAFLPAVSGLLVARELEIMGGALENPKRPFVAVLGGAKVSDKIGVINNLLEKADNIIIGGGMAYTFARAQGGSIGKSLCEPDKLDYALEMLRKAKDRGVQLLLPTDTVAAAEFSADADSLVVPTDAIREQLHNKAACRVIKAMLDKRGHADAYGPDDALSRSRMLTIAKEHLGMADLRAIDAEVAAAQKQADGMTAWRIEGTLREFARFDPVNLWFDYPVHKPDTGLLEDLQPDSDFKTLGSRGAAKRWGDKGKVTKDKKAELDTAFEACMMDGEVTVYALAEYMDLKPRTIKTRLKDDGRFWIDGEKVGRKEPGSAG